MTDITGEMKNYRAVATDSDEDEFIYATIDLYHDDVVTTITILPFFEFLQQAIIPIEAIDTGLQITIRTQQLFDKTYCYESQFWRAVREALQEQGGI